MLNRTIKLLTTIPIVVFASACSSKGESISKQSESVESESVSEEIKKQTINFAVDSKKLEAYKRDINEYLESNNLKDYITVNYLLSDSDPAPDIDDVDLFMSNYDLIKRLVINDLIAPISSDYSRIMRTYNLDKTVAELTYGDKTYGFPLSFDTEVVFYDGSRIDDNDVKSWEALTEKLKNNAYQADYNYSSELYNHGFFATFNVSSNWDVKGSSEFELVSDNFNSKEGLDSLKRFKNIVDKDIFVDNINVIARDNPVVIATSYVYKELSKKWGENLRVAPLPKIENRDMVGSAMMTALVIKNGLDEEKQTAIEGIANYLTSTEIELKRLSEFGIIPARNNFEFDSGLIDALRKELKNDNPYPTYHPMFYQFYSELINGVLSLSKDYQDSDIQTLLTNYENGIGSI